LPFHDHPPDIPIEAHQLFVDGAERLVLRRPDPVFHLGQKAAVVARDGSDRCCFVHPSKFSVIVSKGSSIESIIVVRLSTSFEDMTWIVSKVTFEFKGGERFNLQRRVDHRRDALDPLEIKVKDGYVRKEVTLKVK
jgi:hypothetical protein